MAGLNARGLQSKLLITPLNCTASTEKDEASKSHTNAAPSLPPDNYKARLNEYCQKHYLPLPIYKTEFPEDSTGYIAVVKVGDKNYVSTVEMAKKTAEQKAAGLAALDLGIFQIETKKQDESPSESQSEDSTPRNFKAVLQEFLQKRGRPCPRYSTEAETGGMFVSTVTMTDVLGRSACFESRAFSNKRIAEQDAARQACINFKI